MDARVFLVLAVHEIAVAAELAIAARATEKPDTYTLTNVPTSHARADSIDAPNHFMAGYTRPINRKQGFHSTGIGMANPASLDANTHLTGARIDQRFHYGFEFSRFRYLDCSIHCAHIRLLYVPRTVDITTVPSHPPGAWMSAVVRPSYVP